MVAFLLIALGVMLVIGLIGRAISKVARTAGLGGLDSLLGAIFGVIRGCFLVVVAIIAIAAFVPRKTGCKDRSWRRTFCRRPMTYRPVRLRNCNTRFKREWLYLKQGPNWIQFHLHPPPATR